MANLAEAEQLSPSMALTVPATAPLNLGADGSSQLPRPNVLRWLWRQWWLVTMAWWVCALLVVINMKHCPYKSMLTAVSNLFAGLLVAPFALYQGLGAIRSHCGPVFLIAVVSGLERNLTNLALRTIGAALKTALHGFNVPLTFLAAVLFGADPRGKACCFQCQCREDWLLIPALGLVTGGSFVAAALKGDWHGGFEGIVLQSLSSISYAVKYAVAKLLLGGGHGHQPGTDPANAPPSKVQIAFVANPVTGLVSLALLPLFDESWTLPPFLEILAVAFGVNGILFFELRLVELTSPLTVSVLAAIHNVVIVLYFLLVEKEDFKIAQQAGFAVSTVGCLIYARAKSRQGSKIDSRVVEVNDA